MKTKRIAPLLFVSLWLIVGAGCITTATQRAERLVSSLPKLTSAVEALVRYPYPANPVLDDLLVAEAIKYKPELQKAFKGYPIKLRHDAKNVVVLVCSPDGKYAWLEDASWTLGVDHQWFMVKPPMPADFTMDPAKKDKP